MVAFTKNDVGVSRHPQGKKQKQKNFNLNLIPYKKKINSKWIMGLNVKHNIINLLEKKTNQENLGIQC